jgi:EAL domain-containing protein (putative c-di-GMP-specific phosphodiesterase class I)
MEDLGAFVLARVGREAAEVLDRTPDLDYVSVNVAPRQLSSPGFADGVLANLHETGLAPTSLVLEITELALVDDLGAACIALADLRRAGVRIALDDFGTGHATLTSLRQLPLDMLKIDRSFVAGLGESDEDATIVGSVAALAKSIGVESIAEGVESPAQAEAARALGCRLAQGHRWSPAVPLAEVGSVIEVITRDGRRRARPRGADLPGGPVEIQRITELHGTGASAQTIAAALNRAGLSTTAGNRWHATQVLRVLDAIATEEEPSG